jgi:hypothetical protein
MSALPRPVSWPADLQQEVIDLIELLFSLLDSKDAQAGLQLAQDVFTEDGKFFSSAGYFQGQGTYAVLLLPQYLNLSQISLYHAPAYGKTLRFDGMSFIRYMSMVPTAWTYSLLAFVSSSHMAKSSLLSNSLPAP